MNEEVEIILDSSKEQMKDALDHLNKELSKIRVGRASPNILSSVVVEYYGSKIPLSQVSGINTIDARTLSIQPWEKDMLEDITKAINTADLGLNPQNNGEMIIISVPILTEERRKELCKQARQHGEKAKISIRNTRKETNDTIKKMKNDASLNEDQVKEVVLDIQKITNDCIDKVDGLVEIKSEDIMKV